MSAGSSRRSLLGKHRRCEGPKESQRLGRHPDARRQTRNRQMFSVGQGLSKAPSLPGMCSETESGRLRDHPPAVAASVLATYLLFGAKECNRYGGCCLSMNTSLWISERRVFEHRQVDTGSAVRHFFRTVVERTTVRRRYRYLGHDRRIFVGAAVARARLPIAY